jgi:hypothetical protein
MSLSSTAETRHIRFLLFVAFSWVISSRLDSLVATVSDMKRLFCLPVFLLIPSFFFITPLLNYYWKLIAPDT